MKKRKKLHNFYNLILVFVIFSCLILLIFQNSYVISGKVTELFVSSNVSVANSFAISFSENLSEGIIFGNVSTLPAVNINASHNYDGISSATTLFINVSKDGNTAVDFCIKANANLTSIVEDVIELGNETYSNSTSTNISNPDLINEVALTTSYFKSGDAISIGNSNYYRFWLDVPASQPSGDYNNTLSFKGVQTSLAC